MHRFFVGKQEKEESLLWLSPEESRHAVKVLRIKEGERILVFDSESREYEAEISEVNPKGRVGIKVLNEIKKQSAESVRLHVALGFLQKSKMDWIVEKGCEIGISSLTPLETEFSMVHPKGESVSKIKSRWERIVLGALKQSGNLEPPKIFESITFSEFAKKLKDYDFSFLFHPHGAEINLKEALELAEKHSKPLNVLLLIGPEGGFSEKEVQAAKAAGVQVVRLGRNILRAETAFAVLGGMFKILT